MDPAYNHMNNTDPQGYAEAALSLAGYQQNIHQQYMQDPQQYQHQQQQQQQQYAQQYQQQMQQHYAQSQNQHYQPQQLPQQQQPPQQQQQPPQQQPPQQQQQPPQQQQPQPQHYVPQPTQHTVPNAVGNGRLPPGRPKGALGKKGKKAKDPNRPKRPTSAYFFFIASKREEAKMRGQQISKVAEWTKQVSAIWREMGPTEKKEFESMAVADKKRFETQMQAYSGKRPKDANRPKRPQSAYFCFLGDFRAKKKSEFTGEGSHKELIRAAGEAWNSLGPAEKIPYEHMAELEKQKYEEAMKIYNAGGIPKKPKVEPVDSNSQKQQAHLPQQHYNSVAATAPIENDDEEDDEDDDEDEDE